MSDIDFIHRYLPGSGDNPRVWLLLHGTGGDESDLLPLGRELDADATLLSPRGKVSENGAPRFFRRFAEGLFDEEDVVRRANERADFVAVAAPKYKFAADQITAVGYSNGANIAAAMLLVRPETLAAAILFRAMVPLSDPPGSDLSGKSVLISSGRNDPIIPLENAQRLTSLLRTAGADVRLEIHQANHALVQEDLLVAKRWLSS